MGGCANFVKEIEADFYASPDVSALESLFRGYERVVFKSVITSFGLERLIADQYGGDVDTILNVRSAQDGEATYRSERNAREYEARGQYSHKDVEGTGTNYQQIKHDARAQYGEDNRHNTVTDAYGGGDLHFLGKSKGRPTDINANLDHVVAAKSIHDDRGRVLAGLSTRELADLEDNLRWTNEGLNKSMKDKEIPDYLAAHPEIPRDTRERMMDAYNQAHAEIEQKIRQSYYFSFDNPNCRLFYRDTAVAAANRGAQMGIRQLLGFIMAQLWMDVRDALLKRDDGIHGAFMAIGNGVRNWVVDVRVNYRPLIEQFGQGLISGIMASLSTTLTNVFAATAENIVGIIRQAWASAVEATSVLLFNSNEQYFCDRMTSAAKVLATGASMVLGTTVQQLVEPKLAATGLSSELIEVVSTFTGALSTGLLAVSLLFYIDNNPFGRFLDMVYGEKVRRLERQGEAFKRYCAELRGIDFGRLEYEVGYMHRLSTELSMAKDGDAMNAILRKAVSDLDLPVLWGNGTLDAKMSDPTWVLRF